MTNTKPWIQEAQRTPSKISTKKILQNPYTYVYYIQMASKKKKRNHGRSQDRKRGNGKRENTLLYLQEEKDENDSRFQKPYSYKRAVKYLKC